MHSYLLFVIYCNIFRKKYLRDTEILNLEKDDMKAEMERRSTFRTSRIDHMHTLHLSETKKMDDMTERWRQTQIVKKNRRTRDLQFELSQLEINNLKSLRDRQVHTKDETNGIEQFERNMKRMGISGNDGADQRMSISYETKEAYQQRIRDLMNEKLPKDEEIDTFKSQLKERTASKRLARYEKARRRRRALVDQANTLGSSQPESNNA